MMRQFLLLSFSTLLIGSSTLSCASRTLESLDTENQADSLSVGDPTRLWQDPKNIHVCYEPVVFDNDYLESLFPRKPNNENHRKEMLADTKRTILDAINEYKSGIKSWVPAEYAKVGFVFKGFLDCENNYVKMLDGVLKQPVIENGYLKARQLIRISFRDGRKISGTNWPHSSVGIDTNYKIEGMVLSALYQNICETYDGGLSNSACKTNNGKPIMSFNLAAANPQKHRKHTAIHEFGHAIGLMHEQLHFSSTCHNNQAGETRATRPDAIDLTKYDPNSVMNYCASNDSLTDLDQVGIKKLYAKYLK